MVRRLEKIEKEMGYCEVKLEKERRLRRQAKYLKADLDALQKFLKLYEGSDLRHHQLSFSEIAKQVAVERSRMDEPGPAYYRAKDDFVHAGVFQMVREDLEILRREQDGVAAKLASYEGFTQKKDVLASERDAALEGLAATRSVRLRKLNDEFQRIEARWNSLTEDALNLDEAVFYMTRCIDYVRSARTFLITAKGSFDIESWIDNDHQTDLFRHSNIGRAKEMIDGACRNLKVAEKELCCVENVKVAIDGLAPLVVQFLEALFEDIFLEGRLRNSLELVEKTVATTEKMLAQLKGKVEELEKKILRVEKQRAQLFQRLGGERRGRVPMH